MATTGTTAVTSFDTRTLIDRAYGAIGVAPQQISSEKLQIALDELALLQADTLNDAAPLWTVVKHLVTPVQGNQTYTLPAGTNDVHSAFYRTMFDVTPASVTVAAGAITIDFGLGGDTLVNAWKLFWTGQGFAVVFQTSPDGITWTTVNTTDNMVLPSSAQWYDIDNASAARYWRVIPVVVAPANVFTGLVTVAKVYNTPSDILMARLNQDDYWQMTNKAFQGRPLQFWLDRTLTPTMNVWPAPDAGAALNVIVVRRQRFIMDVGSLTQSIEFPLRWFRAVYLKLGSYLADCTPDANQAAVATIGARAQVAWNKAWLEERDKSPFRFQIDLSPYTR